jgi:hypothetical protein
MYVCIYIHIYIYIYIYIHTYIHTHTSHVYARLGTFFVVKCQHITGEACWTNVAIQCIDLSNLRLGNHLCACVIFMCVCVCVCLCVSICLCIFVCVYLHTYARYAHMHSVIHMCNYNHSTHTHRHVFVCICTCLKAGFKATWTPLLVYVCMYMYVDCMHTPLSNTAIKRRAHSHAACL